MKTKIADFCGNFWEKKSPLFWSLTVQSFVHFFNKITFLSSSLSELESLESLDSDFCRFFDFLVFFGFFDFDDFFAFGDSVDVDSDSLDESRF